MKIVDQHGGTVVFVFSQLELCATALSDIRDRVRIVKTQLQATDLLMSGLVTMLSSFLPKEEMAQLMGLLDTVDDREGTLVTCMLAWCGEQEVAAAGGRQ